MVPVCSDLRRTGVAGLEAELPPAQLYDLAKGSKPVLSKGFPSGDSRKAAHMFMNEVITSVRCSMSNRQ